MLCAVVTHVGGMLCHDMISISHLLSSLSVPVCMLVVPLLVCIHPVITPPTTYAHLVCEYLSSLLSLRRYLHTHPILLSPPHHLLLSPHPLTIYAPLSSVYPLCPPLYHSYYTPHTCHYCCHSSLPVVHLPLLGHLGPESRGTPVTRARARRLGTHLSFKIQPTNIRS
jgi:hypothetical protein